MALTRGSWPRQKRNAEGLKICRNCEGELPNQRRSYCTPECSDAFYLKHSPQFVRSQVHDRDKGVCAGCKLDTDALDKTLEGWQKAYAKWKRRRHRRLHPKSRRDPYYSGYYGSYGAADIRRWLTERGFNYGVSLWDADHIVPVVENGGECGLENYQTLCVPCHKAKSAEDARRRSKSGRQQRMLIMEETSPWPPQPSLP